MSRRRKRTPIPVEDRGERTPAQRIIDALPVLARLDPQCIEKLAWAAESFVAIHERPNEPDHEFRARVERINPSTTEVN